MKYVTGEMATRLKKINDKDREARFFRNEAASLRKELRESKLAVATERQTRADTEATHNAALRDLRARFATSVAPVLVAPFL